MIFTQTFIINGSFDDAKTKLENLQKETNDWDATRSCCIFPWCKKEFELKMKHILFLFILLTLLGCTKGQNVEKNYKEIFDADIKAIFNTKSNISSKLEEYFEDRKLSYESWSGKEAEEETNGLIIEDKLIDTTHKYRIYFKPFAIFA